MEEDIKILEYDLQRSYESDIGITKFTLNYIQNLIARYKELETIVKTYNAIPNDYMPNDLKIVIADREYFNNGILKENIIPKSKVKEIIYSSFPDIAIQKLIELIEENHIPRID